MKWEHDLGDGLRDLARTAAEVPENPATERALLDAFDAHHGVRSTTSHLHHGVRSTTSHSVVDRRPDPAWVTLAAAAALLLLAGGWWVGQLQRSGSTAAPATRQAAVQRAVEPSQALPAPPSVVPLETPPPTARATREPRASRPSRPFDSRPAVANGDAEPEDEFITLPAADRLPALESGMIVRVELDITSLPAYGFPIMPDSTRKPVAADVLVGQDGQPRAIRLVSMQTEPRRR